MPEVSIVTPVYNSEAFLEDMLGSVLRQSFSDWELLVVDDCSKDESSAIVEEYAERDSRIKLVRLEKNSGAAVARNAAIEVSKGRYIAFLDSDDMWHENKLEIQLGFMKRTKCSFSYTNYELIKESGRPTGVVVSSPQKVSYLEMLRSNKIGCLTAMYDTDFLGKVYMPLIRKRQDYALWLDILKRVPYAEGINQSLSFYRQRSGSISSNKFEMMVYHWQLFRNIEKLSFLQSVYFLTCNICNKVFKN